jgi:hypothetical protein
VQAVEDGGADDDGRAVLVVMEDGNLHALAQLLLDIEALRRLDVFEIDAAEGRLQRGDGVDQLVRVALVDFESKTSMLANFLNSTPLPSMTGLAASGPMAQAEDGRAVGDDADQIGARGQRAGFGRIGDDFLAGKCNARRVGQRQIVLVGQLLDRGDRDLARLGLAVIVERGFA